MNDFNIYASEHNLPQEQVLIEPILVDMSRIKNGGNRIRQFIYRFFAPYFFLSDGTVFSVQRIF